MRQRGFVQDIKMSELEIPEHIAKNIVESEIYYSEILKLRTISLNILTITKNKDHWKG